jgi:hypothetical protein
MQILVIGGGLFGCCAAIELARAGFKVDLIDRSNDIMLHASRVNHNRIHLGYHYLRSIETAEQSIEGLLSFLFNYGHAVENQFPNYYAIAKEGSRTTPDEFLNFCSKVGIGYDYEYPQEHLLDKTSLNACFKVPEPVFDYSVLKKQVGDNLKKSGVNMILNAELTSLSKAADGTFHVNYGGQQKVYGAVVNASYASFNNINAMLGIPLKKLLYEQVVIPEFRYSHAQFGLTVMDGPFCSVMPKGKDRDSFLLYHVKQSVFENSLTHTLPEFSPKSDKEVDEIYRQSTLFMPFLREVKRVTHNEVTRVVHRNSDDARLTELYIYPEHRNYFAVLSGKITTCIQVALEIKHILQGRRADKRFRI